MAATTSPCWSGQAGADSGVLVLRNGNVLQGSVTHSGDYYRVESGGASLQVPAEQVQIMCRTLEEAYELRRRDRVGSSVDSHLELARWCLRHDLLDQAAREILDARTSDPGHPSLATLDLQLRQRLEAASRATDSDHSSAQSAGATTAAGDVEPFRPNDFDPSTEAQTQFVRSIQPMLIHSCATSGCHQPGARQQMQLDRWALEGNGNATLIRRNLASVLTQINKDDPPSSPLIQRARQAHRTGSRTTSTPLATYQAALLLEWLNQAAGVEPEPPAESSAADGLEAGVDDPLSASLYESSLNGKPGRSAAPEFTPRDPFDPEIFNRRFASRPSDGADQRLATIPKTASSPAAAATEELPAE